ncbi:hypothetical protein HBI81_072260 [Parastagonospora nodorum]|nr:hypothetical protein HBH51_125380 [Parastagonospora nodorum]KAH3990530.1 hypothetical protein HBH52_010220 [Parastagonospora nodorum]KAH4006705.1 hypothetical protein HBI10_020640 [Parastagonospora nodorum]KAH4008562.1 hypothetical protein HBI13_235440 [Parastagonospora nodorum]KAH4025518.1 hypothetical protein HBI09_154510 [Parastagonospora nodorum]
MIEYLIATVVAYVGWCMVCLELNYRRASSMGIPLIRVPVDYLNVPFQVIEPHIFTIIDLLPASIVKRLPTFVPYMRRGWFFHAKANPHVRYGPAFALVTPRTIWMQVCDSEAVHEIFTRRSDFLRPQENYKLLEVYGPCVASTDLKDWPRHRKALAAPFNESIMKFVWSESLSQAKQMVASWTTSTAAADGIISVAQDTRILSLNVLAATGFRRSFDFKSSSGVAASLDTASSYRDALATVLDNIIVLVLLPRRFLSHPLVPKSLQRVGKAADDFQHHMEQMLEEEMTAFEQGTQGAGSLMTSFVRAANTHETKTDGSQIQGLSIEEVYGNMFLVNFAGHDTTANTFAFSILLLATSPKVQDWLAEEICVVTPDTEDWDYSQLFPKLLRCRAVLLETLRLFPPILSLPRHTNTEPQRLQIGDRTIVVPANTNTYPNVVAIQTHPQYWPDPLEWKPDRWVTTESGEEVLITPPRDTFLPWSDGPQNCPGIKFAQVEFVAVLALIMCRHRLRIQRELGETEEQARTRVHKVLNDCDSQLLLRIRDATQVRLICEAR